MDTTTKIFIHDDDVYFGNLLAQLLKSHYLDIKYFRHTSDLISSIQLAPEILLLDHRLEDGFGTDLIEDIRKSTHNRTNIIYLTSQEQVHIMLKAMNLGAIDYIEKSSFTSKQIRYAIEKIRKYTSQFTSEIDLSRYRTDLTIC